MLGALFVGAWFIGDDFSFLPSTSSSVTGAKQRSLPESELVSVTSQSAGSEVIVESVRVPPPGAWVAVREVNDVNLGNVLGAVRVTDPRNAISIPLLRATEPNLSYAIELYRDDGDGVFDLSTDSVYVDFATGAPVIVRFTTTK